MPVETWQAGLPYSPQEQHTQDRIREMKQLARSGAPLDLLWAIQQNQLRQHQIVFSNVQRGPQQHQHVAELGQDIMRADQLIREQARVGNWLWLVDRHCRTPCPYEATLALTRELHLVQQEIQRRRAS